MSAAELREAIEKPAERVGLKFEEGIVDALLRDILGEWVLSLNQTVSFVALYIDGEKVTTEPASFDVFTRSGCFQHVNFRQR